MALPPHLMPSEADMMRRESWRVLRLRMEASGRRHTVGGQRRAGGFGRPLEAAISFCLKAGGLYRRGVRNALDIRSTEIDLVYPDLPTALEGYRLLHLSDLHFGHLPGLPAALIRAVSGLAPDLCLITGDTEPSDSRPQTHLVEQMAQLIHAVGAKDGNIAVLGNHDGHDLVDRLEPIGIRFLVNESLIVERGGAKLGLTGIDDVHYFYSDAATAALSPPSADFSILLAHTPEMARGAAAAGYRLYLSGHSHGGQIALPDGRPIFVGLDREHRARAVGLWRIGATWGYTSSGAGVGAIPVRINTRGEVTSIRLRRGSSEAP